MNQATVQKALDEIEREIEKLSAVAAAMRASGFRVEPSSEATFTTKKKGPSKKNGSLTTRGKGPRSFVKQVIMESRAPMTTKAVLDRAVQLGWTPNPSVKATPAALVYGTLSYLQKIGEVNRVGQEWTRP